MSDNKRFSFSAILVADNDWAIGRNGGLLARLPEDMKHFTSTTKGALVVMGRKTWESFPKRPLSERDNCIISRTLNSAEGARIFSSVKDFLDYSESVSKEIFVIGGGEIYRALLPYCSRVYLTRVYENFGGDVFFPDIERSGEWELKEASAPVDSGCHKIRFMLYERKQ